MPENVKCLFFAAEGSIVGKVIYVIKGIHLIGKQILCERKQIGSHTDMYVCGCLCIYLRYASLLLKYNTIFTPLPFRSWILCVQCKINIEQSLQYCSDIGICVYTTYLIIKFGSTIFWYIYLRLILRIRKL